MIPPSTSTGVYDTLCIFCKKSSKYLKGKKTREHFTQCEKLRADDTIRRAATRQCDQRILALLSIELVAAEGHYHTSSYNLYTKGTSGSTGTTEKHDQSEDAEYKEAEKQAYEELFLYIRNELIPDPMLLPKTDLTAWLERLMKTLGIRQIKSSTRKHVRRKLENELGDELHFISNDQNKLLVYPDSLSMDDLVKKYHTLDQDYRQFCLRIL